MSPLVEEAAATTGTSLEILAPYLPYGIEVEVIEPYGFAGERYKVWGIDMRREFPVLCDNDEKKTEYAFFGLLPRLLPFAALCTPLDDGTVPAVEVAKLLLNDWAGEYIYTPVPNKMGVGTGFSVHVFTYHPEVGQAILRRISFTPDWNWLSFIKWDGVLDHLENIPQAIDYLRRNHFAVGLKPSDYLPK